MQRASAFRGGRGAARRVFLLLAVVSLGVLAQSTTAGATSLQVKQVTRVPKDSQDFTFQAGGGLNPATFVLDDDGFQQNDHPSSQYYFGIAPGVYSVSQDTPPGWEPADVTCSDGSSPSSIDVASGEDVVCTFSNISSDAALVQFNIDAQPDSSQIFFFRGLPFPVFLNDDGAGTPGTPNQGGMYVRPGTFKLTQDPVNDWRLTSASCSDGSPVWALQVQANESVVCSFVNQAGTTGRVTIVLDSEPDDPQVISFEASGGLNGVAQLPTFQLADPTQPTAGIGTAKLFQVAPGSGYGVSEQVPSGWDLTATCSDGSPVANIDVSAGENITCTFRTRERGQLTIKQDTQPDDPQDFSYTIDGGLSPSSFVLDDDGDDSNGTSSTRTFSSVPAGTYLLTQQAVPGWSKYIWSCSNGSTIDQIVIKGGEDVTCTVRNTRPGSPAPASSLGAGGVNPAGTGSEGVAQRISANGRYVVFETYDRLDPVDTDTRLDVYWRDLRTGEVRLVSRASGATGAKANYDSGDPDVSADGRYVAFSSGANNLDPDDPVYNDYDVYVRDMVSNTTTLVTRTYPGSGSYIAQWGGSPSISADGRYIAFSSRSRYMTPDPENDIDEEDIYVRDMVAGTTILASRASGANGADSNHFAWYPSISGNGRYVAFQSAATNLDPGDTDGVWDIFVRDTVANTTTLVSRASGPSGAKGTGYSSIPKMSGDGRYVTFFTDSSLDPADPAGADVYVRDLQTFNTVLASPGTGTAGSYDHTRLSLSEDGRYLAYDALASGKSSVYLRDLQAQTTSLISRTSGNTGDADRDAYRPSVASGGRFVSFLSEATNLAPDDNGNYFEIDLFVRDTQDNVTSLESRRSPTYPRPKAATPSTRRWYPPTTTAQAPTASPAAPLSFGSCAPPSLSSPRAHDGHPRRQRPARQGRRLPEDDRLAG